jgi:hypothetical protein
MTAALKSKLAIGTLVIAGLAFLDGVLLLCHCPGPFVFAVPFTVAAFILGSRWSVRVIAVCVCLASILAAVHEFERKQHLDAKIKAMRESRDKLDQ